MPEVKVEVSDREARSESDPRQRLFAGLLDELEVESDPDRVRASFDVSLERIGEAMALDRCQILEFSEYGRQVKEAQEWCRDNLPSTIDRTVGYPCSEWSWWMGRLRSGKMIVLDTLDDLPMEAESETTYYQEIGVTSLLSIPLRSGDSLIGAFNLHSMAVERHWSSEDVRSARLAANAIAAILRRTRAERALARNEANTRGLLDNLEDFFFILDTAGRVLHFNNKVEERLGFPVNELRRMTAVELFGLDWHPGASPNLSDLLAGRGATFRLTLATREIGRIPVELKVTRGEWNHKSVLFAVCRDMTERHRAQDNLRQSEARTNTILAAIPDAMLRLNSGGEILGFTPGDLPAELAIGSQAFDDLPQRIAAGCQRHVATAIETGEMQIIEIAIPLSNSTRTFEIRLSPMGEDEGLAIVRDISERARLEQAKADFINRASHEMRTPLTTALLMADLIREGGEEDEVKEYWRILRLELTRQHELVEDLLAVGRLETGRLDINLVSLDLRAVLEDGLKSLSQLADARRLELVGEIEDDLPNIKGDGPALRRVFNNLLDNAVKFSPAGGRVRLLGSAEKEGVRVRVIDSGIGIPPEELPHLFDRFFRASNAVEAEIRGTGVGLYIVKTLIEAHGGTVHVESDLDQGTTFDIWLPEEGSVEGEGDGRLAD